MKKTIFKNLIMVLSLNAPGESNSSMQVSNAPETPNTTPQSKSFLRGFEENSSEFSTLKDPFTPSPQAKKNLEIISRDALQSAKDVIVSCVPFPEKAILYPIFCFLIYNTEQHIQEQKAKSNNLFN